MISRKRAKASICTLIERGLVTPDQALSYRGMIEEGVSYKTVMMSSLGKIIGELYVREEEAQHFVIHKIRISLGKISVPEMMVLEDDIGLEPWHNERWSERKTKERFEQEASEPWHRSLLEKFRPDRRTLFLIGRNPEIAGFAPAILKMAYGV